MVIRARELGIPFDGTPGPLNAITDVAGVEVGHATLIDDNQVRPDGTGRIRTGVTIIHPRGRGGEGGVPAGRATLNGTGEWTGTHLLDEIGRIFGPIALTGSANLGLVHHALTRWAARRDDLSLDERSMRLLAVVGETLDLPLNDLTVEGLTPDLVFAALDGAKGGPVAEGNVGGGTGMMAYEFKGGIGTASRVVNTGAGRFAVGALVQANHARREDLVVAGVPVGREIADLMPVLREGGGHLRESRRSEAIKNSLLVVLATDAPLLPHQLQRLARRAILAVGRNGSSANNLSGELMLAFSTAGSAHAAPVDDLDSDTMNALFAAAVQAGEEAMINQLVASSDMMGNANFLVHALPHDRLRSIVQNYGRLVTGC